MKDLKRMHLFKKLVKSPWNQHDFGTSQISEITFWTLLSSSVFVLSIYYYD